MRKASVDLYSLMAKKGVRTVTEVAENTHLSRKALYQIINGQTTRIDFDTILKLCTYFKCDVGELIVLKEETKVG